MPGKGGYGKVDKAIIEDDSFAFITWQQVAEYGNGSCTQMVQSVFERKIMQHFQNLVYHNKYGKR